MSGVEGEAHVSMKKQREQQIKNECYKGRDITCFISFCVEICIFF